MGILVAVIILVVLVTCFCLDSNFREWVFDILDLNTDEPYDEEWYEETNDVLVYQAEAMDGSTVDDEEDGFWLDDSDNSRFDQLDGYHARKEKPLQIHDVLSARQIELLGLAIVAETERATDDTAEIIVDEEVFRSDDLENQTRQVEKQTRHIQTLLSTWLQPKEPTQTAVIPTVQTEEMGDIAKRVLLSKVQEVCSAEDRRLIADEMIRRGVRLDGNRYYVRIRRNPAGQPQITMFSNCNAS